MHRASTSHSDTAPRTYKGRLIGYERVGNRYWIGGQGYVFRTNYLVWNPANPARTVTMTEAEFSALTRPALRPVLASAHLRGTPRLRAAA